MPFVLHEGAVVMCAHGGQAQPLSVEPRVTVGGQPVTTQLAPYTIAGCPLVPPAPGPCVTAQWLTGATRVTAGGAPLLLQSSQSVCAPTGTPLQVVVTQTRVQAQ